MGGDYTRFTFDPSEDHSGVLKQQGRVDLDADFNELVEIFDRRWRAETIDIIGRGVVPRETPDGFHIQTSGGTLTIGRGRIYVDGLLAENHGAGTLEYDPILGEQRGIDPIRYDQQPYYPDPPALPTGGTHVVYLDVWQREVTAIEDPSILEKAVGVDTTTRLQTVWQVKVLPDNDPGVTCATDDDNVPGWTNATRPSAGRLSTQAVGIPQSDDPCFISPSGGYRGLENRLYRVEIHDGGTVGTATFKWSRDNASILTAVTAITPTRDKLTVTRTGRDSVLRFNVGDWVEVIDDVLELAGKPGIMAKIKIVDDAEQSITLEAALPAGTFPTTGSDNHTTPSRHTRIRRWDQSGIVRDVNNNQVADVDAGGGIIKVPTSSSTTIILEDGVEVTFSTSGAGGFKSGDYWCFAARVVDASVETLVKAPPRGIKHHYCRLAVVTFPATVSDCRVFWPPQFGGGGCDCSACVTPEGHNSGTFTIQQAIEQVKDTGGKVCLAPGIYNLGREGVTIARAKSVRLQGKGWQTVLLATGQLPAIRILNSTNTTVEELSIVTIGRELTGNDATGVPTNIDTSGFSFATLVAAAIANATIPAGPGIWMRNCTDTRLQRCVIVQGGSRESRFPAIALDGFQLLSTIRENLLFAAIGIGNLAVAVQTPGAVEEGRKSYLLSMGLIAQDNTMICVRRGIDFSGFSLHLGETRLCGNSIFGCLEAGINATGMVYPNVSGTSLSTGNETASRNTMVIGSRLEVLSNIVCVNGDGIVVGTDDVRITGNDITPMRTNSGSNGIVLVAGLDPTRIDRLQVLSNRIMGIRGDAIAIRTRVRSGMIKQNIIESVGGGGIVMDPDSSAGVLSVENNQLLNVARLVTVNDPGSQYVGMKFIRADQLEIVSNIISGVGLTAIDGATRSGIQMLACTSVRCAGNEVVDVGPRTGFVKTCAAVEVFGPFARIDIVDNVIRRSLQEPPDQDQSIWRGVRIVSATEGKLGIAVTAPGIAGPIAVEREREVTAIGFEPLLPIGNVVLNNRINLITANLPPIIVIIGGKPVQLPLAGEVVAIRGNLIDGFGGAPIVDVQALGPCTFGDNRCLAPAKTTTSVALITAGALIVSTNYLQGNNDIPTARLQTPAQAAFTVLGNIASSVILLNNAALPAPWLALNVIAT